jgi:hypothetical protein
MAEAFEVLVSGVLVNVSTARLRDRLQSSIRGKDSSPALQTALLKGTLQPR